jgi:alcohol dehydrogenase
MNQTIIDGKNSLEQIKDIIANKKVFVVSGKNSFIKSGAKKVIDSITTNYFWFSDFTPNPTFDQIQDGYYQFINSNYDIIVAIGGGSSIDVAKAIKLKYYNNIPIVACPTTAGSGSESTYFIVYYKDKEKQSEGQPNITLPEYVVLDYTLLNGLPEKSFASSVLDALSQSVESYWSIYSTEESKILAASSMALVQSYGVRAVLNQDDLSLKMMMRAANLAGQAINITKTTACHSLAYPMTSYFGIDHGHACSLSLSQILKYNYQVDNESLNDSRGIDYVKKTIEEILLTLDCKNTEEFDLWLKTFITKLGLKYKFEQLGIDKSTIIKYGFNAERVKNNPRLLTEQSLEKIL